MHDLCSHPRRGLGEERPCPANKAAKAAAAGIQSARPRAAACGQGRPQRRTALNAAAGQLHQKKPRQGPASPAHTLRDTHAAATDLSPARTPPTAPPPRRWRGGGERGDAAYGVDGGEAAGRIADQEPAQQARRRPPHPTPPTAVPLPTPDLLRVGEGGRRRDEAAGGCGGGGAGRRHGRWSGDAGRWSGNDRLLPAAAGRRGAKRRGVAGSGDFRAAGHSLRRESARHRAVARRTAASPGALPVSGAGARRTAATRSPR